MMQYVNKHNCKQIQIIYNMTLNHEENKHIIKFELKNM